MRFWISGRSSVSPSPAAVRRLGYTSGNHSPGDALNVRRCRSVSIPLTVLVLDARPDRPILTCQGLPGAALLGLYRKNRCFSAMTQPPSIYKVYQGGLCSQAPRSSSLEILALPPFYHAIAVNPIVVWHGTVWADEVLVLFGVVAISYLEKRAAFVIPHHVPCRPVPPGLLRSSIVRGIASLPGKPAR
ncbi:hypothetical protein LCGC14_2680460, partial [marine sediment metagenome]